MYLKQHELNFYKYKHVMGVNTRTADMSRAIVMVLLDY